MPPKGIRNALKWRRLIKRGPDKSPAFLLVESAWENFKRRDDRYHVPIELVRAYRRHGIPTVFWNKEDPMHFEKFLPIALECDVVLTTDSASVSAYTESGCRGVIDCMLFAAQPELHRPYLAKDPSKKLFFAGTLRPHHEDRMNGFEALIRPSLEFDLEIFSRRGAWPEDCQQHVVGSLPYLELLREYSKYSIGLNMSSIKGSDTMFPRRVVEMPMADIFVISDECQAIRQLFPEIPECKSPEQTRDTIGHFLKCDSERLSITSALKERITQEHCYHHRVDQILSAI